LTEHKLRVLTVDDNDALRYSLARILQDGGYHVLEARTGSEALAKASHEVPDLVTLDINLPDINGFEVCRRLRQDPSTSQIPILHISASFASPEDRARGLEGGADAYLSEPIQREELLATVSALFRLKKAEREARLYAIEANKAKEDLKALNQALTLRVHERTAELEQRTAEVEELSRSLLRAQDDERRRISRELHDSTGQLLVTLKLNLALLASAENGSGQPSQTNQLIASTSAMVDEISRQLRTMSYLLHPPLLEEAGLAAAIRWYIEGLAERSNIQVRLDIPSKMDRLHRDLELTIFRIMQESLTNVHRHSQSKTALVKLVCESDRVELEISDEGKGIPIASGPHSRPTRPGVGITGMKERVQQFGGKFEMISSSSGTSIRATLPALPVASASVA
jgi:signal transduction histidine kinase